MKLQFYLRFHTRFGQSLWICGNIRELGNNDPALALQMEYLNNDYWQAGIEIKKKDLSGPIRYKYMLKNENGELLFEWAHDRSIEAGKKNWQELLAVDTWNHAGEFENAFFTTPFQNVLLKNNQAKTKSSSDKGYTHIFRVKAPLLRKNEAVCLLGNGDRLKDWNTDKPVVMEKDEDWWTVRLDLSDASFPLAYKYGVYNTREKNFVQYEGGNNRLLYSDTAKKKLTILHDGFVQLPNTTWKGAGVAIPVFSLRSKNSFGVGEFTDIRLLVDWAKNCELKLIQLLPINDTIATHTWMDSYPYAAISAFALHPLYINLANVAGKEHASMLGSLKVKQKQLNELAEVNYEEVIKYKLSVLKELYEVMGEECFESGGCKEFYEENKDWLQPYSAFCFFRDKYGSSHFEEWKTNGIYNKAEIEKIFSSPSYTSKELKFYCFVQYHLHLQLKEAVDYAHKKGIVLKGDIPIGIYRYGCDAWVAPEMVNMCWQAGAPPDDFTAVGQNWGFPTYNWKKCRKMDMHGGNSVLSK